MPAGRPRKPTAKLKLHGTNRADRRHADEPEPEICIPKKPAFLKGPAAKEWKRITVELHEQKLLSEMDLAALSGYCHAYGEVIKIDREIGKYKKRVEAARKKLAEDMTDDGDIFISHHPAEYLCTGSKGGLVLNPLIKARNSAWELVLKFGREFGLSPVARTRISTGKADEQNAFLQHIKNYAS